MENLSIDGYLTDEQSLEIERLHEQSFFHVTSFETKLMPAKAIEKLSDLRWAVLQKDFRMATNSINYFNNRSEYTVIKGIINDLNKMLSYIYIK